MSEKFKHILGRILFIGIVVGLVYFFFISVLVYMIDRSMG